MAREDGRSGDPARPVRVEPDAVHRQERPVGAPDLQIAEEHPVGVPFATGQPSGRDRLAQQHGGGRVDGHPGVLVEAGVPVGDEGVRQVLDVTLLPHRQVDDLGRVVELHPVHLGGGLCGQVDRGTGAAVDVDPVAVGLDDAAAGRHQIGHRKVGAQRIDVQRAHDLQRRLLVPVDEFGPPAHPRVAQFEQADLAGAPGGQGVRGAGEFEHPGRDPPGFVVRGIQPRGRPGHAEAVSWAASWDRRKSAMVPRPSPVSELVSTTGRPSRTRCASDSMTPRSHRT